MRRSQELDLEPFDASSRDYGHEAAAHEARRPDSNHATRSYERIAPEIVT